MISRVLEIHQFYQNIWRMFSDSVQLWIIKYPDMNLKYHCTFFILCVFDTITQYQILVSKKKWTRSARTASEWKRTQILRWPWGNHSEDHGERNKKGELQGNSRTSEILCFVFLFSVELVFKFRSLASSSAKTRINNIWCSMHGKELF